MEPVRAEKASKQIVQVGMQRRSYDLYLDAPKIVAAGRLGNVRMVRSWWLNYYLNQPPAAKLDGPVEREQWQGPAKRRFPVDSMRFRNWRYFSDYSNGVAADQGAHAFDGIHLLMNAPFPVTAIANKIHSTQFDMPESIVTATAAMNYQARNDQFTQLDGDQGSSGYRPRRVPRLYAGAEETAAIAHRPERGFAYSAELHVRNFLECFRTRKRRCGSDFRRV